MRSSLTHSTRPATDIHSGSVGSIAHAASFEDAADVDHIVAIVAAIQRGGASEFHLTPSGIAYAGHTMHGDDFEHTTADLGARDLLGLPV